MTKKNIFILLVLGFSMFVPLHQSFASTGEHHGAPVSYYLFWMMLIAIICILVYQFKLSGDSHGHTGEHEKQPSNIPISIIALVFLAFLIEMLTPMGHYHEPMGIGMLRFLSKAGCAVMFLIYGLSFCHEEHDDHNEH